MQKSGFLLLPFLFLYSVVYPQTDIYVLKQYNSDNGLPQNSVKFINFDRNGFCWLATESGIVRFDNRNFKYYGSDLVKGLKGERISTMMMDTSGNIFAKNIDYQTIKISASSSIYSFLPVLDHTDDYCFVTTGYLTKSPTTDSLWEAIRATQDIPVLKPSSGLRNGGIYLLSGKNAYFIHNTRITKLESYDTAPVVSMVFEDRFLLQIWENNRIKIWHNSIGQTGRIEGDIINNKDYQKGAFKALWCEQGSFIFAGDRLYKLYYNLGKVVSKCVLSNLSIETPLCIAYRPDINTYFIGTATQGFYTIKPSDFIYPAIPEKSGPENYYSIAKTSDDKLILNDVVVRPDNSSFYVPLTNRNNLATYTDSLDRVYYEGEFRLLRYHARTGVLDKPLLLLNDRLRDIIPVSKDGTLLLCTHTSLYKITTEGKIIWQKKFPAGIKATGLLPLNNAQYLLSTYTGVKWYNLNEHKITKSILDSLYIRTVYRDKANRLWIGTDGKGSFLYVQNELHALPPGPRGAFKSIHSFIEDSSGNFWLPTNNGLYKVKINALADFATGKTNSVFWFTFNKENGLRTTEFNGGANPGFQWLKDGALALPSINGLVKFYPDKLKSDYPEEKIYIDEIAIDGQNIDLNGIKEIIHLKPTFQALNVKVTCPYFGNNENLKLEYRIGTEDEQWVPVPSSGIISINRLPANQYTLVIRKAGSNSNTPNGNITLNLEVTPFFYQTNLFFLGTILLIVLLGYLYSRRRLVKLEKEKLTIEKIVEVRTEELSAAIHQLESSETALKKSNEVKEQIIATVLHDLRSPLYSMRVTGKALVKNWNNSNKENLDQVIGLNHLIGELSRFTDQFFSWAASQQDQFKAEKKYFSLQQLLEDIEALFKEILLVNNNKFSIDKTDIECYTDKDILILVLRNLVDNANKNTENGVISIKTILTPEGLQIQVSDTGKGLNTFQIENFLNRDKAVKNGRMGSVIILEMLSKINGELFVSSEQGKGSVFTITLKASDDNNYFTGSSLQSV